MEGLAELPPPPALLPPAPLGALERGGGAPEASRVSPQEEAGIASEPDEAAAAAASEETREEEKQRGAGSSSTVLSEAAASLASRLEEPRPVAARDATTPESPSQAEATAAPSPGSGSSGVSGPGSLSPAGGEESASLADSLGSFSNLPSCDGASISDLNGGGEDDDDDDSEEAAPAPRRAPVAGGEDDDDEDGVSPSKGAAAGTASVAAAASSSSSSASPSPLLLLPPGAKERFPGQSVYHIKWVRWKEENTPIITQNENGPCPLLAIMNVLLLAWKVKLPPMMEIITAEQLMEYLGDYILDAKPKEISEIQRLNYEQNMSDAMAILHKLQTGLDVNVRFTGVRVFEYTPECIVFDLLDIPLYHGWLVDPQTADIVKAVGNCSYNQLVEKIICCKQSDNTKLVDEGSIAEQFLNNTATQLTYHGLCELTSTVQEGELCVFFRNNHFSTMTKHKGQLYLLVTDQGFLTEDKVVWESLHNVDGDGNFCDSEFHLRPPSDPETVYRGQQDQIDQSSKAKTLIGSRYQKESVTLNLPRNFRKRRTDGLLSTIRSRSKLPLPPLLLRFSKCKELRLHQLEDNLGVVSGKEKNLGRKKKSERKRRTAVPFYNRRGTLPGPKHISLKHKQGILRTPSSTCRLCLIAPQRMVPPRPLKSCTLSFRGI
ncbi:ubiquitin carboxyl-terminal hydrolase MINDY-2 isoform X1 [Podarcis lilfordi]|uniref:Ubiquitin carboxyl-terminal hydrolase n=1 Tax=Podarcis lilfordi TaxID=74358 RepID=A0AA35PQD6_9SAUR|nr:ubiquitin carboxyl-terminal hydrolase MINDY-2 isoform X1 [Podarcis lilfordi]